MPETKVITGALTALAVNLILLAAADSSWLAPLPDDTEGIVATIFGLMAAYIVKNRHLSPSSLATAAKLNS